MGCMASSPRVSVAVPNIPWGDAAGKGETVGAALTRLDEEIANSEKTRPAARLAVVSAELDSLQQEIKTFEETTNAMTNKENYAKTIHQVFVSLDLYRRPVLASENEDFIANVNRKEKVLMKEKKSKENCKEIKNDHGICDYYLHALAQEMRRMELSWLHTRLLELQRERRVLHAQILRTRALYGQLRQLLESLWSSGPRPGAQQENALSRASALRDALASVSARLQAAAEYAHAAARLLDDALPSWKLASIGKSGWERTEACADACRLLVQARCLERGARRVLAAPAAPRAARSLRLALDYAFTDALHDHKYQRATEIFIQFKEALVQLITSIHQVLLNNLENLTEADKNVVRCRRELRATRVRALAYQGLAEMTYQPRALTSLKSTT